MANKTTSKATPTPIPAPAPADNLDEDELEFVDDFSGDGNDDLVGDVELSVELSVGVFEEVVRVEPALDTLDAFGVVLVTEALLPATCAQTCCIAGAMAR